MFEHEVYHDGLAGDKPVLDTEKCLGRQCDWWQICEDCCPENAIDVTEKGLSVNQEECVYCFACAGLCVNMAGIGAIIRFDHLPTLGRRIADSALATMTIKDKGKALFLNYGMDVTPFATATAGRTPP